MHLKDMCWDKALYMIKNNKIKTLEDLKYKAFYRYPFKVADHEKNRGAKRSHRSNPFPLQLVL